MILNTMKFSKIFPPQSFGERRVTIIGAGAIGSNLAEQAACHGIQRIRVIDFDTVADHNLANQRYGVADVGRLKVEALRDIIRAKTGTEIEIVNKKFEGDGQLGPIVFLAVDSMAARKQIWERAVRLKPGVKLMVDTRMGAMEAKAFAVEPTLPTNIDRYEKFFFDDTVAVASECGTEQTVGATAAMIAGLAMTQLIMWFDRERGGKAVLQNEVGFQWGPGNEWESWGETWPRT